uniref:Kielin/chordin-like protein n=1 Tax=Panagrellus redivivus TaxID=6233 RepID=A0A7E4ZW04_PANRE
MATTAAIFVVVAFYVFVADGQPPLYPTNFAYPPNYGYPVNYGYPPNFAYPPNSVYSINIFYPTNFGCPNHSAHHHNSNYPPNPNNAYPNSVPNPPNTTDTKNGTNQFINPNLNNTGSYNGTYPNKSTLHQYNITEEPLGRVCFHPNAGGCIGGGDVFDYGCHDVADYAHNKTDIVATSGKCFYLFEYKGCEGRRIRVAPGCYQDDCCPCDGVYTNLDACNFTYGISSYMLC